MLLGAPHTRGRASVYAFDALVVHFLYGNVKVVPQHMVRRPGACIGGDCVYDDFRYLRDALKLQLDCVEERALGIGTHLLANGQQGFARGV